MKIQRILCWLLSLALLTGSIYTADTLVRQRRLARKTVRLHVIANSDEAADQAQKLRVRDGVAAAVLAAFVVGVLAVDAGPVGQVVVWRISL